MKQARVTAVAVGVAAALLSGCAVMNPYVHANDEAVRQHPTLAQAVDYAAATREKYYCAISQHTMFNRSAGVVLIGVAGAAASLGITGGSTDVITSLGVGGASLFGLSRLLYSDHRLRTYAAGAQAITCEIGVFEPLRSIDTPAVDKGIAQLGTDVGVLRSRIDALPGTAVRGDRRVIHAQGVVDAADTTLTRAHEVLSLTAAAGVRLYDAVEQTRAQVNKALLEDEPDLAEVVATASQSIRANAGLLTGQPGEPATGTRSNDNGLLEPDVQAIDAQAKVVEASRLRLEALLAGVGANPTAEQLKACAIDPDAAGLSFHTDPASTVVIDTSVKDSKAVIAVRGGKPPYHARFVGSPLPTDSELTLPPVDHGDGGKQGIVTIKPGTSPRAATYRLQVTDDGAGERTLTVTVVTGKGGGGGGGGVGGAVLPKTKDPIVSSIQNKLIAAGCLKATGANGESSEDGQWGTATETAARAFFAAQGEHPSDFATFGSPGSGEFLGNLKNYMDGPAPKPCTPSPAPVAPAPAPGPGA